MSYSEKEALKQLPEASSWPKFSGTEEYDHMELIDYIVGLFIVLQSIPDYWITARLNTAFKGHADIWYTQMKEIHGRGNLPWWKSQIIQKYRNGTWIWQKTILFENDKHSVDKDSYEWCLTEYKRLKAIGPKIYHSDEQSQTPDTNARRARACNVRKRTNIGKYFPHKSSGLRETQPFKVALKDKNRERVAEVTKKKNSRHNFGSTDYYANNCPKAKKKVYAIEKAPEEESPTEDSESDSMGDAIREQSDEYQDQKEEFLVEYQEETPLEIQHIQLEAGMPHGTDNKNLCKHAQVAQTFLVQSTKGIAYINGTATKMTVFIHNAQQPFIIESGAHCSIVARNYLDHHLPNWEKQCLPNKAKNFKSASGKMTSIGRIIKDIIRPDRKCNIRLNPDLVVLEDAHIQGFLLGTDYQRMYGMDIYNSKDRNITIGTNKQKKLSLDIYQISTHEPLEELLNGFREGQFSTTFTSEQKLSLRKMLRKNRPEFAIGKDP
ncbi:hypothetical protein O181_077083 [Austropuccinia psidii MF-1]|uniref:Uncharacterized protein n=1 Tax=Austropuccinia psidii MF-1 TaxID=1389203 RepID=A0A9Q3IDE3_9BASI|nr:hypothetical protein [Austropuccinia psidii MF-1]